MSSPRIRLSRRESWKLVSGYTLDRIREQVPPVLFMVAYLVVFQVLVLGLPIANAFPLAGGIGLVILGLACFLEGLSLGLMPLGETIGLRMPKRTGWFPVMLFALILGILATLAEPAVGALKLAGSSVRAWESPVLFALLGKYAWILVGTIGLGVGLGVVLSMIRYYRSWPLKTMALVTLCLCMAITVFAVLDPKIAPLAALAWDSGGITTGPVTVPLVLALGMGISRMVGKNDSPLSGFGVVTMASLVPVITVLAGAMLLSPSLPGPMDRQEFARTGNQQSVSALFENTKAYEDYVRKWIDPGFSLAASPGVTPAQAGQGVTQGTGNSPLASPVPKCLMQDLSHTPVLKPTPAPPQAPDPAASAFQAPLLRLFLGAAQAVLPLCTFLLLTLLILRQRLERPDEMILGIALGLVGMFLLNAGLETGLSPLGNEVGKGLPSTIKAVEIPEDTRIIPDFDLDLVYRSTDLSGKTSEFFWLTDRNERKTIPFDASLHDPDRHTYTIIPVKGPLFGEDRLAWGMAVLMGFAFLLGFGATMAEPALITMGKTVENITVGTFSRKQLMNAVAIGVGIGVAFGVFKLVAGIPLLWLLVPPYLLIVVFTILSDETFVNIAWDSAGVTTGPVTVPLVIAMGLGLGSQLGVQEGFGILALASAWPILTVLLTGLRLRYHQSKLLDAETPGEP